MSRLSLALAIAFCLSLPFSADAQGLKRATSVSADLYPTLFFDPFEAPTFEQLPYEVVEIEVLPADVARSRGFLGPQHGDFTGQVIIESWERFAIVFGKGVKSYMDNVANSTPLDLQNLLSNRDAKAGAIIKVGVAFRAIIAVSSPPDSTLDIVSVAQKALKSGSRVWGRIEVVGIGSKEMTQSLPGLFSLLSGEEGVNKFIQDTTTARKEVWGSIDAQTTSRPSLQVLGWVFDKKP